MLHIVVTGWIEYFAVQLMLFDGSVNAEDIAYYVVKIPGVVVTMAIS